MISFPNCKINLGLHVVGRRPDGYHDLETLFLPVTDLCDELEIVEGPLAMLQDGITLDNTPEDNLCMKAWQLLHEEFSIPTVSIRLKKDIPFGAGLGGGSSDAAFTLKMLAKVFQLPVTEALMLDYALQLGSDVPFFLYNRPMYATGRGEVMTPVELDLSRYRLKIVKPDIHVSTKEAYSGITPKESKVFIPNVLQQDVETWKGLVTNDFEVSVFEKHPELREIKESFYREGARYAAMSGSGSAVFGIF